MGLNKKNKYANEVERRNGVKEQIKNENLILFVYTTYLQVMFRGMLVDILEKMSYSQICDLIIDNALLYGELISFTTWKTRKEEYRRPINFFETVFQTDIQKLPKILDAKAKGRNFYIDERVVYDNPFVIAVNPADFVFDVSQFDDFDNCPKIYRTWRTPDDIINNKCYGWCWKRYANRRKCFTNRCKCCSKIYTDIF